jgi:hypothetical protein
LFKPVFSCGSLNVSSFDSQGTENLVLKLHADKALRGKIERTIEQELGLPKDQTSVLVFCPRMKMTFKPIRVLVTWKDGSVRRLNEIKETEDLLTAKQINVLEEIYYGLWKLYLFVQPSLRCRGDEIQRKFVEVLKRDALLFVNCDPALQNYLETGCEGYKLGKVLASEIEKDQRYANLGAEAKLDARNRAYSILPADTWDDSYSETGDVIAARGEPAALIEQVRKIIDSALTPEPKAGTQGNLLGSS